MFASGFCEEVPGVCVTGTLLGAHCTSEALRMACAVDYLSSDGVIFGRGLFFHVMFYSSGRGLAVGGGVRVR